MGNSGCILTSEDMKQGLFKGETNRTLGSGTIIQIVLTICNNEAMYEFCCAMLVILMQSLESLLMSIPMD